MSDISYITKPMSEEYTLEYINLTFENSEENQILTKLNRNYSSMLRMGLKHSS